MILPFFYRLLGYRSIVDRTDSAVRRARAEVQAALDGFKDDVNKLTEAITDSGRGPSGPPSARGTH